VKSAVLLLLLVGVASAYVVGYHIEPVQADWSGWIGYQAPNNKVSEFVTCNFDSLSYVELFAGAKRSGGQYRVGVWLDGHEVMWSYGDTVLDHGWIRFERWRACPLLS
jgi:hypothetical protein